MRRCVANGLLAVLAGSTVACSSPTSAPSNTAGIHGSTVAGTRCGPEAPDATYSTTTTAPCIPTTTTTTTTTLPVPLALGEHAELTVPSNPGDGKVNVTISRIWIGVTPAFTAGPPGGLAHALQFVHAPSKLQWIGIAVSMTNAGPQQIGMISNGRYQPYLDLVVTGSASAGTSQSYPDLVQLGFYAGVSGCPLPFPNGAPSLAVGATVVGCLAVPIPSGSTASSIGFSLGNEGGGSLTSVALWSA